MQGSNPRLLHLLCWQVGSLPLSHLVITRSETTGFRPWRHIGVTWFLSKPHVPGARLLLLFTLFTFSRKKKSVLFSKGIHFQTVKSFEIVVTSVTQSCPALCGPWTAAHQASLSITNSWSLLKFMPIESVMPSSQLILCRPLLLLPSIFPSIRVFSSESALRIRWP